MIMAVAQLLRKAEADDADIDNTITNICPVRPSSKSRGDHAAANA